MGRREGSAGPGHSFHRLWMHSFPTLTVSSVLASRPPRLRFAACRKLVGGRDQCRLGNSVSRFLFVLKRPALGRRSSTPATSWPPLPPSRCAVVPGQPALPAPQPCSPTVQVLPVPLLFMTLSRQSGPVGKQMASANQGNSRRIIYKGDYLANGQGHGGLREPAEESSPPGPAQGGQSPTPRLEGNTRGGPQKMKKDSPRGHLTLTLRAMTFNQVPACPRPPDLPGGHFTEPADWVLSARKLWIQVMEIGFFRQETRFKHSCDAKSCTLYTPCLIL